MPLPILHLIEYAQEEFAGIVLLQIEPSTGFYCDGLMGTSMLRDSALLYMDMDACRLRALHVPGHVCECSR